MIFVNSNLKAEITNFDDDETPEDPSTHDMFAIYDEFPTEIHKFQARRDIYSTHPVTRGHIHKHLSNITSEDQRVTYNEFKKALQCAPTEPGLDGNRGSLSFWKMTPMSRNLTELVCLWSETKCTPWHECNKLLETFRNKDVSLSKSFRTTLTRIINGKFYYDWPWGRERFDEECQLERFFLIIPNYITSKVSDIGDSLFLNNGETPWLPFDIPFPGIGRATYVRHDDYD